jgi:predicted nucleic acid-binding protein
MARAVTVDACVVLSWVLPGAGTVGSIRLRDLATQDRQMVLHVPPTFFFEVASALSTAAAYDRISIEDARAIMEAIEDFRFRTWVPDLDSCMYLAQAFGLSVYDSAYLQVASESMTALWTLDYPLAKVANRLELGVQPAI